MKRILFLIAGLLLLSLNVFADDVSIDGNGNVSTGVTNSSGNLEVTGSSGEDAIVGRAEDTGAAAVYGEHTVNSQVDNFGILGDDNYGVYGNSVYGYAGFFQGNARVTGDLTVNGALNASISETDPVFSGSPAFVITSGNMSDWNTAYGWGDHAVAGYDTTNDSWTGTGNVYTLSGNVGIGTASPSYNLHVVGLVRTEGSMWSTSTTGFGVYGQSNDNLGVWGSSYSSSGVKGDSSTGYGVEGTSTSGAGGYFSSSSGPGLLVATGNVGIGTSSPGAPLHIRTGSDVASVFESTDATAALEITDPNGTVALRTSAGDMLFGVGGYEIMYEKARITSGGNVGIGTSSPNEQLEITGNLRLPATTATTGIIKSGANVLLHIYGNSNMFAGVNSGNLSMSGGYNTGIGHQALRYNTAGSSNTAIGSNALINNTVGASNSAMGSHALFYNTAAGKNTAVGAEALFSQSYINSGTAWDSENTAVGFDALFSNQPTTTSNGKLNIAVGSNALRANTTGSRNTAIGVYALYYNTSSDNTATGAHALYDNITGTFNTAVGSSALTNNTTGNYNIAIGNNALWSNTTGSGNTVIGVGADTGSSSGSYNTLIGHDAAMCCNVTNATAIGNGAAVVNSNSVTIGNGSVTSIGGYAPWSNFSDRRVKKDIEDIEYGIDLIKSLKPVQYRMKNGNGNTDFGFVAQDIEAVLGDSYNVLDVGGGEERMLSLRYAQFIAPMVKAMQQQQEIIDGLMKRIDELEKAVKLNNGLTMSAPEL